MKIAEMRRIAEAASGTGPWGQFSGRDLSVQSRHSLICVTMKKVNQLHIATFDPPTVLKLLDALEALPSEIAADLRESWGDYTEATREEIEAKLETWWVHHSALEAADEG